MTDTVVSALIEAAEGVRNRPMHLRAAEQVALPEEELERILTVLVDAMCKLSDKNLTDAHRHINQLRLAWARALLRGNIEWYDELANGYFRCQAARHF